MNESDEVSDEERRNAYRAQVEALGLKPWQEPPCAVDPDVAIRGTQDELRMMALRRRMIAAGVSRWAHDPLGELAKAEGKQR
jgi:hypothetical protein